MLNIDMSESQKEMGPTQSTNFILNRNPNFSAADRLNSLSPQGEFNTSVL